MSGWTAGQTVVLLPSANSRGRKPEEVKIERVARKYVYIRDTAFDIETGVERTNYPGSAQRIQSLDEFRDQSRRTAARLRLDELGIRAAGYGDYRHSTATLEALIAVLEEEAP